MIGKMIYKIDQEDSSADDNDNLLCNDLCTRYDQAREI